MKIIKRAVIVFSFWVIVIMLSILISQQFGKKEYVANCLSFDDVKKMLKEKGFFCQKYEWSELYCNPDGKGIENKYILQDINGDSVVFDAATNLIWQRSGSANYMNYENAKKYIDKLNHDRFAESDKWRLPTLEEAMSVMEPEQKKGLYINLIFDSKQRFIWTANKVPDDLSTWIVSIDGGYCQCGYGGCVRAVRSRQSS